MLGTYACAIVICVVALVLGRGACVLCGVRGSSWLSAPVGLSLLLAGCEILVGLPGHGYTASAILLAACIAAVVLGVRRGEAWPAWVEALPVALVVLGFVTVPFIANDRVGVLGVSVLNDTHWHLFLAQGLLDPSIRHLDTYGVGYPLGPHAIAAVFSQGLGTSVDRGLTGLLMATPILTGLAALGAMPDLARWQRTVTACLVAIPYMAAAWYVQSAFKEPIMSLLLLGIVLALQEGRRERYARLGAVAVPIGILLVGVLYDYSYPGLVWPAAVLACWAALELSVGGAWSRVGGILSDLRAGWPALTAAVVVALVLVVPTLHRIYVFWTANAGSSVGTTATGGVNATSLANLAGPLSPSEGLNLWLWGDFRFIGPHVQATHLLAIFALVVLVVAAVRALWTGDLPWLGAAAGVVLVYIYARHAQSPYVAAKALAVPAPILVLGSASTLMRGIGGAPWQLWGHLREHRYRALVTALASAATAVLFFFGFKVSYVALADAMVDPSAHTVQLRSLRALLHGKPTLAIYNDDYFKWELLGVPVSEPGYQSPIPVAVWPQKPWTYGTPLDFDNFSPTALDGFDYAVTVRSFALSQPPPNWHAIGGTQAYEVYRRVGPTPRLSVLPESGGPGAVLDCRKASDRRISREPGVAAIRATPIDRPVAPLAPGGNEFLPIHLPRGRWQLSLPFTSTQPVQFTAPGLSSTLPANLDRPGNPWPIGEVTSTGRPLVLHIHLDNPAPIGTGSPPTQFFTPETLIAARPKRDRIVALRHACGRYVDWYRVT